MLLLAKIFLLNLKESFVILICQLDTLRLDFFPLHIHFLLKVLTAKVEGLERGRQVRKGYFHNEIRVDNMLKISTLTTLYQRGSKGDYASFRNFSQSLTIGYNLYAPDFSFSESVKTSLL